MLELLEPIVLNPSNMNQESSPLDEEINGSKETLSMVKESREETNPRPIKPLPIRRKRFAGIENTKGTEKEDINDSPRIPFIQKEKWREDAMPPSYLWASQEQTSQAQVVQVPAIPSQELPLELV